MITDNLSVKDKILKSVLRVSTALILIMAVTISVISSFVTSGLTEKLVDSTMQAYRNQLHTINEQSYVTISMLREQIYGTLGGDNPRTAIISYLQSALGSNSDACAYWAAFEPNALDGNDAAYAGTDGSDANGRFLPCVSQTDGSKEYLLAPLAGLELDNADSTYYYGALKSGQPFITEPFSYSYGGVDTIVYSICIPLFEDGKSDGTPIGVVGADVTLERTKAFMDHASILDNGYLFLVSGGGTVVTSPDTDSVLVPYTDIHFMGNTKSHIDAAVNNGIGWNGIVSGYHLYLTPVSTGSVPTNWVMCGVLSLWEYYSSVILLAVLTLAFGAAIIILISGTIRRTVDKTLKPLDRIIHSANRIARGEVDQIDLERGESDTKDEITLLGNAFLDMSKGIQQQTQVLAQVAGGDYSIQAELRSDGDIMGQSIQRLISTMNTAFWRIRQSATEVHGGASQIADAAQALAEGATHQAATIEELTSTIAHITDDTIRNNENSEHAASYVSSIESIAEVGKRQMEEMTATMSEISLASNSIHEVINTIQEIASQTNLLALNAAIEAARAGDAGKGFAVVADEVRNLANKSAQAAQEISQLIDNSIQKTSAGNQIASETSKSLHTITEGIQKISQVFREIASASKEQTESVKQMNAAIDAVALVVQNNAAMAEESAASSEELNSQVELLNQSISRFHLRENRGTMDGAQAKGAE
jgi:methyl-accepting chemotaxis protein